MPLAAPPSDLVTILDDDVPLANLPKTGGGKAPSAIGKIMGLLGMIGLGILGKKKEEDEEA